MQPSRFRHRPAPWADPQAVPLIRIEGLSRSFGAVRAVDDVSLAIYEGEFFTLVGASGCGKTTLLRLLAGLEVPDSGRIRIDGADVTDVPPYRRPVNMVFQSYALFPHMTVENNVAFGLRQEGLPRVEIRERVRKGLALVGLDSLARRRPHELSGGERQRVALCRALVKRPKILLLDEPLAALDRKLRESTRLELVNIQERVGITFVLVTHDQEEAMTMSSRIAVMRDGRILQTGPPREIYEYPASRFVAEFVGDANLFDGVVCGEEQGRTVVRCAGTEAELSVWSPEPMAVGRPVTLVVRPEKMVLGREPAAAGRNALKGTVHEIAYLGDLSVYHVTLASGTHVRAARANIRHDAEDAIGWDEEVYVSWSPASGVLLAR